MDPQGGGQLDLKLIDGEGDAAGITGGTECGIMKTKVYLEGRGRNPGGW